MNHILPMNITQNRPNIFQPLNYLNFLRTVSMRKLFSQAMTIDKLLHQIKITMLFKMSIKRRNLGVMPQPVQYIRFPLKQPSGRLQSPGILRNRLQFFQYTLGGQPAVGLPLNKFGQTLPVPKER